MSEVSTTTRRLRPEIASRLSGLRRLIHGYVAVHGVALSVIALVLVFWITLALDWLVEPPAAVRVAMLVLAALAIGAVLVRALIWRLIVPMSDESMAMLLERRHPRLGDRLLTVVELTDREPTSAGFDPKMLEHTDAELAKLLREARSIRVFRAKPLMLSLVVACVAAGSLAGLLTWRPATFQTWVDRNLRLSDRRWPRDTLIVVDGFTPAADGRRVTKVAAGSDLEVHARADTRRRIPDVLEVRYTSQEGSSLSQSMTRQGSALPGRDPFQNYVFKFKNVQNSIRFDVLARRAGLLGKDDRVDDLWIEVVESPTFSKMVLRCRYPAYLKRKDESLPVTGVMAVPEGTEIVVDATANKSLISAECRLASGSAEPEVRSVDVSDRGRRFEMPLGIVRRNTVAMFTLHDTDEVRNRQPLPLQIRAVADEIPEVDVRLSAIGKAITPRALLPLRGKITDDHEIARSWFEFHVLDRKEPARQEFRLPRDGRLTPAANVALDAQNLDLKPGGRLHLWIKAADNFPLDKGPHVGTTIRYELEVITESQLRALLETSELLLRRRLEGVIAELERARDSLARLKSSGSSAENGNAGDTAAAATRGAIRVEEALQSGTRTSHETAEIAGQFDGILEELQNNRVDGLEQLRSRLHDGIAVPLARTVAEEFPRLRVRLLEVRSALADNAQRTTGAAAATEQIDVILVQLKEVMSKMAGLESFNEMLAQLRGLIESQEKVTRLTRERGEDLKTQLRKALEE